METTLWILKGGIALIFVLTGGNKIIHPKAQLLQNEYTKGLRGLDAWQIKGVGILEVLGACGVVLPSLFNIFTIVSAIAALCLGLTMIVAGWIHFKHKQSIIPNIVLLVVCLVIAISEFIRESICYS